MRIVVENVSKLVKQSKEEDPKIIWGNIQPCLRKIYVVSQANIYPVIIDYKKSIKEMVLAGQYDRKCSDINANNFSITGEGIVQINLELIHFNRLISSEDILIYFEKNYLRPAMIEELLAFGATYFEIQQKFPVIGIGSSLFYPDGCRYVPCLNNNGHERNLCLSCFESDWDKNCRFLAVYK